MLPEYSPKLNGYQAAAFLAIHADSCVENLSGFKVARMTHADSPETEDRLVAVLYASYEKATGLKPHLNTITDDMRQYHALRRIAPDTPGAIIECGFMGGDRAILTEQPDRVAEGIARGPGGLSVRATVPAHADTHTLTKRTQMNVNGKPYRTVWMESGVVRMINQPLIPFRFEIADCPTHRETATAIRTMIVRGAGAIGAAGGLWHGAGGVGSAGSGRVHGLCRAGRGDAAPHAPHRAGPVLCHRPRARGDRRRPEHPGGAAGGGARWRTRLADENAEAGAAIGRHGAELIPDGARILTHCNAGWLAFVDWGSALSPIYTAARQGKRVFVYVDETRPRSQGAQLTAWELEGEGIPHAIIADNAAGYFMRRGEIDMVIVGADRIARNGDVANKIGTYEKAVCAAASNIPFYVAAPLSTLDPRCPTGDDIPIEERSQDEVLYIHGRNDRGEMSRVRIAHEGAQARNPAFDVTPARYVKGIITQWGYSRPNPCPRRDRPLGGRKGGQAPPDDQR